MTSRSEVVLIKGYSTGSKEFILSVHHKQELKPFGKRTFQEIIKAKRRVWLWGVLNEGGIL
jgi:hypothetical protein